MNRLPEIRRIHNVTQEQCAHLIGISLTQYRNIEKNRTNDCSVSTAIKIAKIFNMRVEDIFFL